MLDRICIKQLQNNLWYRHLPAIFQQFILTQSHLESFDKEQTIFASGDLFNGLYAVLQGSIRLCHTDINGMQAVAAIVNPIMWFGEISMVDQQPRSHHAIATQKSVVLHIPADRIQQLLLEYPQFWFHIAQLTSQKLRFAFLELVAIQTQTMTQRLAQRLIFILNGYGNHIQIEHNHIDLSQEQLAQMLICSRQTINQELQTLEKMGVLKTSFKKIEVLDYAQLHALAQDDG